MSRKKFAALLCACAASMALFLMAGCSSNAAEETATDDTAKETAAAEATEGIEDPTPENPITVTDGEVRYLAEVNEVFFTESTRHGVVFKDGSNGEKSILRGLGDEKEFYQAMLDAGFTPGDNLVAEDMKAPEGEGKAVEGDKLNITVKWEGQEEIPFQDIVKCTEGDYVSDYRFGGNLESAKQNNTGCVVCLDSCATGITSDATWVTGTTNNKPDLFYGNGDVLPSDGTYVVVTFRPAE